MTGLIPAHAGKTDRSGQSVFVCAAHPRSRGENRRRCDATDITTGSSPLTRGKPNLRVAHHTCNGLIPAHAGKTLKPAAEKLEATAHPRSRGENDQYVRMNGR